MLSNHAPSTREECILLEPHFEALENVLVGFLGKESSRKNVLAFAALLSAEAKTQLINLTPEAVLASYFPGVELTAADLHFLNKLKICIAFQTLIQLTEDDLPFASLTIGLLELYLLIEHQCIFVDYWRKIFISQLQDQLDETGAIVPPTFVISSSGPWLLDAYNAAYTDLRTLSGRFKLPQWRNVTTLTAFSSLLKNSIDTQLHIRSDALKNDIETNIRTFFTKTHEKEYSGLEKILNACIAPIHNDQLKPLDIYEFARPLSPQHKELLANINPRIILQMFFPQAQLSDASVEFLEKTVITIRSKTGLLQYSHSNSDEPRTLYEVSMGFLGLFLLLNFDVYLRIMSTPNYTDSRAFKDPLKRWGNIGVWDSTLVNELMDQFDPKMGSVRGATYDVEIIPPKNPDLSFTLEQASDISEIGYAFNIFNNLPGMEPDKTFSQLQDKIKIKLCNLDKEMSKAIFLTWNKFTNLSELRPQMEVDSARLAAEKIITQLPEPFHKLFQIENNFVWLSYLDIQESDPKQQPLVNFFTFCTTIAFLLYAKLHSDYVCAAASYKKYKGEEHLASTAGVTNWIYSVLAHTFDLEIPELLSQTLNRATILLRHHEKLNTRYPRLKKQLPLCVFNALFANSDFLAFMQPLMAEYPLFEERSKLRQLLENLSSEELLAKLLAGKAKSHEELVMVRKYKRKDTAQRLNEEDLLAEYNIQPWHVLDVVRIRPATGLLAGIPISTYSGVLEDCAGTLIIRPSGASTEMLGFKRPAFSNTLNDVKTIYGFPHSGVPLLRPQGGKPSYTIEAFSRRLFTKHIRHHKQFYDLARKDFLATICFLEFSIINKAIIYQPFGNFLSESEKSFIKKTLPFAEVKSPLTEKFLAWHRLFTFVESKIRILLEANTNNRFGVAEYYLELLTDLSIQAIDNPNWSLNELLDTQRKLSGKNKLANIPRNQYHVQSRLLEDQKVLMASSGHSYQKLPKETVYLSNEILLQGLRVRDNRPHTLGHHPVTFQYFLNSFSVKELIQIVLLLRHGNYVANFMSVANEKSVQDAMTIANFLLKRFNQTLPFVLWNAKTAEFAIYSPVGFHNRYQDLFTPRPLRLQVTPPITTVIAQPVQPLPVSSSTISSISRIPTQPSGTSSAQTTATTSLQPIQQVQATTSLSLLPLVYYSTHNNIFDSIQDKMISALSNAVQATLVNNSFNNFAFEVGDRIYIDFTTCLTVNKIQKSFLSTVDGETVTDSNFRSVIAQLVYNTARTGSAANCLNELIENNIRIYHSNIANHESSLVCKPIHVKELVIVNPFWTVKASTLETKKKPKFAYLLQNNTGALSATSSASSSANTTTMTSSSQPVRKRQKFFVTASAPAAAAPAAASSLVALSLFNTNSISASTTSTSTATSTSNLTPSSSSTTVTRKRKHR